METWLEKGIRRQEVDEKGIYVCGLSVCCKRNSPHPECLKLKEHEEYRGRRKEKEVQGTSGQK